VSGLPTLDGAVLGISLANAVLLLWLGLTVALNAERRDLMLWLVVAGLLVGAAFFLGHAAVIGTGTALWFANLRLWWTLGWIPLLALPLAWYVAVLWFAGCWEESGALLRKRHRRWLTAVAGVGALLGLWVPTGDRFQALAGPLSGALPLGLGTLLLPLVYPAYLLLCQGLSLDALARLSPSSRLMGDLARRRARPWLVATTLFLLAVSLLVAGGMAWLLLHVMGRDAGRMSQQGAVMLTQLDLVTAGLILAANFCLGQGIVSYEVFTGKTLPRRGLRRQWQAALLWAVGSGTAVGWTLAANLPPTTVLLPGALVVVLLHALSGWRSFEEREQTLRWLRPGLPAGEAPPDAPDELEAVAALGLLCGELLGARLGYLIPLGPLAPLLSPGFPYPPGLPAPTVEDVEALRNEGAECLAVTPGSHGGAAWALPLWGPKGLLGALLLGEKRDGGLYGHEEVEAARAAAERLLDQAAAAEISRRLMELQRQRLAETQILDQRARRALHDDVLPRLHAALIAVSGGTSTPEEAVRSLTEAHRQVSALLRELPSAGMPELASQGLLKALRALVADLDRAFDEVLWEVSEEAERLCTELPPPAAEVLYCAAREAVRNAARHARGADPDRRLTLRVSLRRQDGLELTLADDGVGTRTSPAPGGAGQGLALHTTLMAVLGGTLSLESISHQGTTVRLHLPMEGVG
jgi:signal transduction histidine kinase